MNSITDSTMLCPHVYAASWFANVNVSVFLYYFTHVTPDGPYGMLCPHGAELPYVLHLTSMLAYDPDAVALSGKMLSYWVNFANNGDPNGPSLVTWPAFSDVEGGRLETGEGNFFMINNSSDMVASVALHTHQCLFWMNMTTNMDVPCYPATPLGVPLCGGH